MSVHIPGLHLLTLSSDAVSRRPAFGFDADGVFITNPTLSDCGRFAVGPLTTYGVTQAGAQDLQALNAALGRVSEADAFRALPAARFESYMPDSPSFAGRVEVRLLEGLVLVSCFEKDGTERITFDWLSAAAGSLADSRQPGATAPGDSSPAGPDAQELRSAVFGALSEGSREYIDADPANLDLSRVRPITFSDGASGAIALWGEACFVSVIRLGEQPIELNAEAMNEWPGFSAPGGQTDQGSDAQTRLQVRDT